MLIGMSCYTNSLVLQNITSNENLRKRWNAKHKTTNEATWCQKLKYYYFEQTSESKIQKYYDIMGSTLLDTGEPQRITRMKAQGSVMAMQDGELYEQIDNQAVLLEYGIDITANGTHHNESTELADTIQDKNQIEEPSARIRSNTEDDD